MKKNAGNVLIIILVSLFVLSTMLAITFKASTTQRNLVDRGLKAEKAKTVLEAVFNQAIQQLRSKSNTYTLYSDLLRSTATVSSPLSNPDFSGITIDGLTLNSVNLRGGPIFWSRLTNGTDRSDVLLLASIQVTDSFGETSTHYGYAMCRVEDKPLTDFLFFSQGDAAINFQHAHTWSGPIHVNGDLRFGPSATQTFSAAVSASGNIMHVPGSSADDMAVMSSELLPYNDSTILRNYSYDLYRYFSFCGTRATDGNVLFVNASGSGTSSYKNGSDYYTSNASSFGSYESFAQYANATWGDYVKTEETGMPELFIPGIDASLGYIPHCTRPISGGHTYNELNMEMENFLGPHALIDPPLEAPSTTGRFYSISDLADYFGSTAGSGFSSSTEALERLKLIEGHKFANNCGTYVCVAHNTDHCTYPPFLSFEDADRRDYAEKQTFNLGFDTRERSFNSIVGRYLSVFDFLKADYTFASNTESITTLSVKYAASGSGSDSFYRLPTNYFNNASKSYTVVRQLTSNVDGSDVPEEPIDCTETALPNMPIRVYSEHSSTDTQLPFVMEDDGAGNLTILSYRSGLDATGYNLMWNERANLWQIMVDVDVANLSNISGFGSNGTIYFELPKNFYYNTSFANIHWENLNAMQSMLVLNTPYVRMIDSGDSTYSGDNYKQYCVTNSCAFYTRFRERLIDFKDVYDASLYIGNDSAAGSPPYVNYFLAPVCYAVRLKNAATLPRDVVIATNGALFIQGDFNTNSTQIALIAADSITVLSSQWKDYLSYGDREMSTPEDITINATLVTGTTHPGYQLLGDLSGSNWTWEESNSDPDAVDCGGDSRGVEDCIRILEKWPTGSTITVNGAILSLYRSKMDWQPWSNYIGSYDNSVNPNWNYNTNYRASNNRSTVQRFTPRYRTLEKKAVTAIGLTKYNTLTSFLDDESTWGTDGTTYNSTLDLNEVAIQ